MFSYCAFQECRNQNLPCSNLTFFTLPKDERRDIWIKNSGNPEIQNLSSKTIKYFCEMHFDPKYVRRQFSRTTLHRTAVPYEYKKKPSRYCLNNNDLEEIQENGQYDVLIESICDEEQNRIGRCSNDANSVNYVIKEVPTQNTKKRKIYNATDDSDISQKQNKIINTYSTDQNTNTNNENNEVEELSGYESTGCDGIETIEYIDDENSELKCVLIDSSDKIERSLYVLDDDKDVLTIDTNDLEQSTTSVKSSKNNSDDNNQHSQEATSSNDDYEEDKHFALSLVGYFQRLSRQNKITAKLKILQYLTDLEFNCETKI